MHIADIICHGQGAARDRLSRTDPLHPRLDLRSGAQTPFQRRAQQGRGQKRARPRPVFPSSRRRSGIAPSKTSATVPPASTSRSPPSSSGTPSTSATRLPSFAPKPKLCPISCSPTLPRSAGSTSASMATTSGHPNRSSRGFGRCEIRARLPRCRLAYSFGTDSAMTPDGWLAAYAQSP